MAVIVNVEAEGLPFLLAEVLVVKEKEMEVHWMTPPKGDGVVENRLSKTWTKDYVKIGKQTRTSKDFIPISTAHRVTCTKMGNGWRVAKKSLKAMTELVKRIDALEEKSQGTGNESEGSGGGGKGKKKRGSAAAMNTKNTRRQSKSGKKKSKVTGWGGIETRCGSRSHRMLATGGVGEHLGFLRETGGRGHCLFHVFSYHVFADRAHHMFLRLVRDGIHHYGIGLRKVVEQSIMHV